MSEPDYLPGDIVHGTDNYFFIYTPGIWSMSVRRHWWSKSTTVTFNWTRVLDGICSPHPDWYDRPDFSYLPRRQKIEVQDQLMLFQVTR